MPIKIDSPLPDCDEIYDGEAHVGSWQCTALTVIFIEVEAVRFVVAAVTLKVTG